MENSAIVNEKETRSAEELKILENRLNRIEGQIKGIKKMLEKHCTTQDILIQSSAVNSAIKSFSRVLLKDHIDDYVADDVKSGDMTSFREVIDTLWKMLG